MNYGGKVTKTGDSKAIRLDSALFKQAPEFELSTPVCASVVGPGCILISIDSQINESTNYDPILDGFLSFLSADIQSNYDKIQPLSSDLVALAKKITAGVTFTDDDFK
jgi:hypothetical protein